MNDERTQLEQAIANIEAQRATLGDAVVETTLSALREKLATLVGPPTEQRKQVTVLFADLSGFTAMSEALDAEEVSDTVNRLWRSIDRAITDKGGKIDKHIGDAVMAVFGVPAAHEDDAECAIHAALEMQRIVGSFKPLTPVRGGLKMRIGINTGPVLMSQIATTGEYTAVGDTVNLASRLEHAAPLGGVLISDETQQQVRGVFKVQALDPLQVKGKVEPVQAYVVEGEQPRSFRVTNRGVEGVETSMVGRDAELRRLKGEYRLATEAGLRFITVVADAGLGKSRLLHEFGVWLDELPEQIWRFKARADQQMTPQPYSMIRDMMESRFGILDSDTAASVREKLERGVAGFLGENSVEKAHFIGYLLDPSSFADSPYIRGIASDRRQIQDRAYYYTAQMLRAACASYPAALLLDDIHWADDRSLDLIEYLVQRCRDLPIVILCLARPALFERRASWGEGLSDYVRLDLSPLDETNSRVLVGEILRKVANLPAALRDLIVRESEGNPFYLEELIKVLIGDGVIIKRDDEWQVVTARLSEVRVPPTLTAVLQARLDSLAPAERETLQQASVVGRAFWDDAVRRLKEVNSGEGVSATLHRLCGKELVYQRNESAFDPYQEYTFKHAILWDVTYESVLKRLRRQYHAEVAEWLIERSGDRVDVYAGTIGDHYERAGKRQAAAEWYIRAAQEASAKNAPEQAIDYGQRALKLLPNTDRTRRLRLYDSLGEALLLRARFEEAVVAFSAMRDTAEAMGDVRGQMEAWRNLAKVYDEQGVYSKGLESLEQVEALADKGGAATRPLLLSALSWKGWALHRLGRREAALKLVEQVLAWGEELDDVELTSKNLNLLGDIHLALGHYEQATAYMEQAQRLYRQMGSRKDEAIGLNNMGWVKQSQDDYRGALTLYEQALAIAEEIGSRNTELLLRSNIGAAHVRLGEFDDAVAALRLVISMTGAVRLYFLSETYSFMAQALLGQGRIDDAREAALQALTLGEETEAAEFIGGAWLTLGMVAAQTPHSLTVGTRAYSATACFAEALRVFSEIGMGSEQSRTLRQWADYEIARGNTERGAAMMAQADEIVAALGAVVSEELR